MTKSFNAEGSRLSPSTTAETRPPAAPSLPADEVLAGVNVVNYRLGQTIGRLLEVSAHLYGLTELLRRNGLISTDELDELRSEVAPLLHQDAHAAGLTLELGDEPDKYTLDETPDVPCAELLPICQAACCRLPFPLSEQDIEEGVVQWDLRHPYLIRQQTDTGYCVHLDDGRSCSIYGQRPAPCRRFDCRQDRRIWADFDKRELSPELTATFHRASTEP